MLQLVGIIILTLVGAAALFGWVQSRPIPQKITEDNVKFLQVPWAVTLSRRIALFILTVLACVLLTWVSSPTVILRPANPANPVTVYVIDAYLVGLSVRKLSVFHLISH